MQYTYNGITYAMKPVDGEDASYTEDGSSDRVYGYYIDHLVRDLKYICDPIAIDCRSVSNLIRRQPKTKWEHHLIAPETPKGKRIIAKISKYLQQELPDRLRESNALPSQIDRVSKINPMEYAGLIGYLREYPEYEGKL